jgi:hypothetical protein
LLFQGYLLQFLQLKDLDVKKQWLYSSWYTLFVAVSLWFVQKSNNVNELRTVIIVIVYIFRRIFLTVMLFLARGIIAGVFSSRLCFIHLRYIQHLCELSVWDRVVRWPDWALWSHLMSHRYVVTLNVSIFHSVNGFCLINYCNQSSIH